MRRIIATALIASGLVAGTAATAAAGPPKEGNYDVSAQIVENPDGTCTRVFAVKQWEPVRKAASAWAYAVSTTGPVVDSRYQLLNPQIDADGIIEATGAPGAITYFAFAPVVNGKIQSAEVANFSC